MHSSEREQTRQVFFTAWQKHRQQLPIEPLEAQLIDVMLMHPEHHSLLDHPDDFLNKDFVEVNPFLHLSLHIALREQINTDRPFGISEIYQKLAAKLNDTHETEHRMMECLAHALWEIQQSEKPFEEKEYLKKLRKI